MAVYDGLKGMAVGQQCAYNGLLSDFLNENELTDEVLLQAFKTISSTDPDVRVVKDLKGSVKLDNISNRIIHYRDISKLAGNPVIYPYLIYAAYDGNDQAMLVLPYENGGYLYARGYYYCMSEAGSLFYDDRNEILEICTDNPDEILHVSDEQMVSAFIMFLTRKKKVDEVSRRYQKVRRRKETIEARIEYMTERLEQKFREGNGRVSFNELLPESPDRIDVTLSFMSLLSMIRNQGYDAEQKENFGEITIKRKENAVTGKEQMDV